ncbi:MAG: FAD-dependent oxidoreductase [Oscillospiraceae bacterium]|jgi:NADPH-dependent 2,4-dienoyl-CoA reductase/sulfur reductase-like enzyme/rhodanese-related sulfurtransferase|nr:FAD-dependent oxidoreductase [Oscillospiraceae bacterium]
MRKIVVIGGVAGGATAVARLRRLDEHARIILIERGENVSVANCGLPYYIGGEINEREKLFVRTPEAFQRRFAAELRLKHEALSIDRAAKTVSIQNLVTGEIINESYDVLILSPGAKPISPPAACVGSDRVFTLRGVDDADRIKAAISTLHPENAVVVGGGFVGLETAENLIRAGLSVSIVEMADQVLAPLDYEMACDVHQHLAKHGVRLFLGQSVRDIEVTRSGLELRLDENIIHADLVIWAAGVRPESALAAEAGLEVNARGGIIVDERMRTSDPSIYAVGDAVAVNDYVTGLSTLIPLAGPANKQARIAADNICGIESEYAGTQGSAIVQLCSMTCAVTGINEKTARRIGLDYDKAYSWTPGHAGYYPGSKSMQIKAIFEKGTGRILGAQIVGYDGVDKRCDVLATAVRAGMYAHDLTRLELCYAPPYSSAKDPVNMIGWVIENLLTGKVQQYHIDDVSTIPRDGSATLLDVRTPQEVRLGRIKGFINVPLETLRDCIGTIPKDKPVYVHCHSGVKSYIACRILTQHGFRASHMAGGYRLYHSVYNNQKKGQPLTETLHAENVPGIVEIGKR